MASNSFGRHFVLTTAGESHGPAYVGIVDGVPAGLKLSVDDIQPELDKRRPGQSKMTTQRREADQVQILSGIFGGKTTGAPIAFLIENHDQRSRDYESIKDKFRPGHADYTYHKKYLGHRDHRGGGRASARETMLWVAAGAIAQKFLLNEYDIQIQGCLSRMGDIELACAHFAEVDNNPFFSADPDKVAALEELIDKCRRSSDSIGAEVRVFARNMPVGLGDPVFEKLDARLAMAMMGIPAVKAVEIGAGKACARQYGSEHRDAIDGDQFGSNHAGGTLGGISSGQDIDVRITLKPSSSIPQPVSTLTTAGEQTTIVTKGRHDPCVGIRAVPVARAMLAMVLMDSILSQRAMHPDWLARE